MDLPVALDAFRDRVLLWRPGGIADITTTTLKGKSGTLYGPTLNSAFLGPSELRVTLVNGGIERINLWLDDMYHVTLRLQGWQRVWVDMHLTTVLSPESYIEVHASLFAQCIQPDGSHFRFVTP